LERHKGQAKNSQVIELEIFTKTIKHHTYEEVRLFTTTRTLQSIFWSLRW